MEQIEHECKYAKMIRALPEWITENGEELCNFCHTPRYTRVTKTPPTRKAK